MICCHAKRQFDVIGFTHPPSVKTSSVDCERY